MIKRKHLFFAAKGVFSIALVAVVFRGVGAERALDRMEAIAPEFLAAAVSLVIVHMVICTLRWRAVLSALGTSVAFWNVFRFFYIGAFFNQALPSSIGGDALRAYGVHKAGVGLSTAVGSVLIDRVATVLALAILVSVTLPFVMGTMIGDVDLFATIIWGLLAVAVSGTAVLMVLDRVPGRFLHLRWVSGVAGFAGDLRSVLLRPTNAGPLMFWSLLGHVNLSMMVWLLALGIGADLQAIDAIALFPPVLLIQMVPVSIAGWGVREGAMVQVFALAAMPADAALAVSILFGLTVAVISLPGGWFWMVLGGRKLEEAANVAAEGASK